jgi:hypothetical protein
MKKLLFLCLLVWAVVAPAATVNITNVTKSVTIPAGSYALGTTGAAMATVLLPLDIVPLLNSSNRFVVGTRTFWHDASTTGITNTTTTSGTTFGDGMEKHWYNANPLIILTKTNGDISLVTLTATSSITGGRFIPTASTASGNSLYLPAANTLGWSINGTNKASLDSTGLAVSALSVTNGLTLLGGGGGMTITTNVDIQGDLKAYTMSYICASNGVAAPNVIQPIYAWASMMGYTTNLINGGANTYAIITNYTTVRTNSMTCNPATGYITNLIAGFYKVGIHLSGVSVDAGAVVEGDLLLNGVEKDEVSFLTQFDPGTPRLKGMSAIGILYIPANTPITFQVKSSGAGGINVYRSQIVIGTP